MSRRPRPDTAAETALGNAAARLNPWLLLFALGLAAADVTVAAGRWLSDPLTAPAAVGPPPGMIGPGTAVPALAPPAAPFDDLLDRD